MNHRAGLQYPLSPMQQGMLFQTLASPHSGVDVEQVVITLPENLDIASLEKASRALVARHDVLRTSFVWAERDDPAQVVHPPSKSLSTLRTSGRLGIAIGKSSRSRGCGRTAGVDSISLPHPCCGSPCSARPMRTTGSSGPSTTYCSTGLASRTHCGSCFRSMKRFETASKHRCRRPVRTGSSSIGWRVAMSPRPSRSGGTF